MLQLFSRAESARAVIERRPNCPADSNLDGSDRSAGPEKPATARPPRLEPVQSGRAAAPAVVRYRDLWAWTDQRFQRPPLLDAIAEQIPFSWSTNLDSSNSKCSHWVIGGFEIRPFFRSSSHLTHHHQAMEAPNDRCKRLCERLCTQ